MKKPYTHYYENIVVSKSSGVKKKLKDRAEEMGMSLTEVIEYLLDEDDERTKQLINEHARLHVHD